MTEADDASFEPESGTDASAMSKRAFQHLAYNELTDAEELYRELIGIGDPIHSPSAMHNLGLIRHREGRAISLQLIRLRASKALYRDARPDEFDHAERPCSREETVGAR